MAVRVTPCKIVAAIRETIEECLIEILLRDGAVSLALIRNGMSIA